MKPYIDTHCHIDSILEKDGISWLELQAKMASLGEPPEAIINVACEEKDWNFGKNFIEENENVYGVFGVHPLYADQYNDEAEARLRIFLVHPKALAIGEIGLDNHYADTAPSPSVQQATLRRQLALAQEFNKRIVFHLREAAGDAFEILKEFDNPKVRAHIHCYTDTPEFVEQVLTLKGQYFFGFTGAITYNKTETVREAAKIVPANRLLLETDAPYLTPVPWRGKMSSHSGMIPTIAATIANVRGESLDILMAQCRQNTKDLYGV
ncbi:TatD family hydrolase [Fibrobacterales bacterium]|nr:TatD family hydrolase [Fibrobacterales bacterium]